MRQPLVFALALVGCNSGTMASDSGNSGTGSTSPSDTAATTDSTAATATETGTQATSDTPTGPATATTTDSGPATGMGPGTEPGTDTGESTDTSEPPQGDIPVGHCGARTGTYFASDNWIYQDISSFPARPDSAATTAWLEAHGGWGNDKFQIDTSFTILEADANTPKYTRTPNDPVAYGTDCDPGVQMPIPAGGKVEGQVDYVCPGRVDGEYTGDCHLVVVDFDAGFLYESFRATFVDDQYYTECDIAWDLSLDVWGEPPAPGSTLPPLEERQWGIGRDCSGPDAAGFPMAPLLFTIGDVMAGKVQHAIRFALPNDRMQRAPIDGGEGPVYVWPATHAGGPQAFDPAAPVYGSRWRLRADFDPASRGLDPANPIVKAVVWGLQHHGMLLADGGNITLMAENSDGCSASWEDLWGEKGSRVLDGILPSDFEVLDVGGTEHGYDCVRNPARE